ncbi:helix-turn-helix transcriptional regulator [Ruegeria arenilitoris]|uniref:helix-turn-helix transcriptional regulator n=1 Tax=Ruegeria arenilitoris TaxID=1173585 RepID=UPI00147C6101|nr:AlpA family phage regulatory protein [Ruegeria arenilitoris]
MTAKLDVVEPFEAGADIDPLLRRATVEKLTAMSRSTLMRRIADGDFPQPVRLSTASDGTSAGYAWRASEVRDWIDSRPKVDLRSTPRRSGETQ